MAIVFTENVKSRVTVVGDEASVEFHYDLFGISDDIEARDHVLANTAVLHEFLPRRSVELTPVQVDTGNQTGHWLVVVLYGLLPIPGAGDSIFAFDTSGGTQHITQSLENISSTPPAGKKAPDAQGAIGASDTTVAGVDIAVPVYTFTETHYFTDIFVTPAYKGIIAALTARVNLTGFKDFAAGEVLFLGAVGRRQSNTLWEITFRFSALPNKTNIQIGNITVPSKTGWQYLWVKYTQKQDALAKSPIMVPQAAYVERVYESGDFSQLGID